MAQSRADSICLAKMAQSHAASICLAKTDLAHVDQTVHATKGPEVERGRSREKKAQLHADKTSCFATIDLSAAVPPGREGQRTRALRRAVMRVRARPRNVRLHHEPMR